MLQGDSMQRTALLKEKKGEFAAMCSEPDCDAPRSARYILC